MSSLCQACGDSNLRGCVHTRRDLAYISVSADRVGRQNSSCIMFSNNGSCCLGGLYLNRGRNRIIEC